MAHNGALALEKGKEQREDRRPGEEHSVRMANQRPQQRSSGLAHNAEAVAGGGFILAAGGLGNHNDLKGCSLALALEPGKAGRQVLNESFNTPNLRRKRVRINKHFHKQLSKEQPA